MKNTARLLIIVLSLLLVSVAAVAQAPANHADLDWSAPYRWVHFDNVSPQTAHVFESCRHNWLNALRDGDHLRGDGRPLFLCASTDSTRTYFTFYPFRTWTEMDARGKMARETQAAVGDSTVKAYGSGDSTLIPPHGSQIWRRETDSDISWTGTDSLTDVSFGVGRMEHRLVDWNNWDRFSQTWDSVRAVLSSHQYPLACRMYTNVYGGSQGDCMALWLARDSASLAAAPSVEAALADVLGKSTAGELVAALDKYFPVEKAYRVERRRDLSNMGK